MAYVLVSYALIHVLYIVRALFHLSSQHESAHRSLLTLAEARGLNAFGFPMIDIYTYPLPASPPFPFSVTPPALAEAGKLISADPNLRSATGVAYTRTLTLLRRELGPHFNLEKVCRDFPTLQIVSLIPDDI
jgi:hypothetical protein